MKPVNKNETFVNGTKGKIDKENVIFVGYRIKCNNCDMLVGDEPL